MQKIYINTTTGNFFNAAGESFSSGYPQITYKSNEEYHIQLCTDNPDADTEGSNPEEWTKDTSLNIPGISAFLSVDKDFQRRRKGTLAVDVASGGVSELNVNIPSANLWDIRSVGSVRIFLSDGNIKKLSYNSVEKSGNDYILHLSSGTNLDSGLDAGTIVDVPDSLYIQSVMDVQKSDPANGHFVFRVIAESAKLREQIEYSNSSSLSGLAGMEFLPFVLSTDNTVIEKKSFVCQTCSISGTIAEADIDSEVPEISESILLTSISALVSQGMEVEFSSDSASWHSIQNTEDNFYRFRLQGSAKNAPWGVVKLDEGKDGKDGENAPEVRIQYSVDGGSWTEDPAGAEYIRFSVDGGSSWSDSIFVRGEQGTPAGFGEPVISASTVPTGYPASATITASGPDTAKVFNIALEIPRGETGERGQAFKFDATGTFEERSQYDMETKDFSFLDVNNGVFYIKRSDNIADWSGAVPFKGDKGDMPFILRGSWYSQTQYSAGDAVTYQGSLYVAIEASVNAAPGYSSYWKLYVSKGDTGQTGMKGETGAKGNDGKDGVDAPHVEVQYSVLASGATWYYNPVDGVKYMRFSTDGGKTWGKAFLFAGKDGENGDPGRNAPQVKVQYYSPSFGNWIDTNDFSDADYIRFSTDNGITWGDRIDVRGKDGTVSFDDLTEEQKASLKGEPGAQGAPGKTPVRGVDYWTDADKSEIKAYVDEAILNGEW